MKKIQGSLTVLEIDFEELYRSLQEEGKGEGVSTREICEKTGWGVKRVQGFLRKAIEAGKCRPTKKTVRNIVGDHSKVAAYVFE